MQQTQTSAQEQPSVQTIALKMSGSLDPVIERTMQTLSQKLRDSFSCDFNVLKRVLRSQLQRTIVKNDVSSNSKNSLTKSEYCTST